jgi:hypothetical protein
MLVDAARAQVAVAFDDGGEDPAWEFRLRAAARVADTSFAPAIRGGGGVLGA